MQAHSWLHCLHLQARKQRRAVEQVAPLLAAARQELDYLAEMEVMLAQLEAGSHLAALQEVQVRAGWGCWLACWSGVMAGPGKRAAALPASVLCPVFNTACMVPVLQADLVAGKYMKAPPDAALADKAVAKARKAQKRSGGSSNAAAGGSRDFRRYDSPSGFAVLVGRNSRQNDELSCRLAQPGDVWMHARGVPGAHLVMRVPAGQAAGEADLRFAADLAAWFSKARTDGKVDVTMCDPKHLSKPSGAKPGQVMVRKEAVVVGRPDQSVAAQRGEVE